MTFTKGAKQVFLVTGATGFVGEHLVTRFASTGHTVVGIGHTRSIKVSGVRTINLDLRDADKVDRLLVECQPDAVFHCAAQTNVAFCEQHPAIARSHIVDATRVLVQAVASAAPQAAVVALSTDLVFDGENAPYREDAAAQPVSVYGLLKLEAEKSILELARGVVLRTSLVYGNPTTHRNCFLAWMIDALAQDEPLPLFEDEIRTPVYINNLCDAMLHLAGAGEKGLWHAGGPEYLSRVAIGWAVCSAFGFKKDLIQSERLANSVFPAPRPRDVSLDCTKLRSLLDPPPLAMREALKIMTDHAEKKKARTTPEEPLYNDKPSL